MATQDFPSNIDRRRLLISAGAFAAFRIEPGGECAEAANLTTAALICTWNPKQGVRSTLVHDIYKRLISVTGTPHLQRKVVRLEKKPVMATKTARDQITLGQDIKRRA